MLCVLYLYIIKNQESLKLNIVHIILCFIKYPLRFIEADIDKNDEGIFIGKVIIAWEKNYAVLKLKRLYKYTRGWEWMKNI